MNRKLIIVGVVFTAIAIVSRLLPHVPNIAPIGALALFAGVYLPKKWSIIVPVIAMLISDVFIGFYEWQVMLAVYLGFVLTVLIGWWIRKRINPVNVIAGSLGGSIVFFLLTNAAVWLFTQMYPHTFAGLLDSYTMAIPFFKFSLVGDLAWTAVFFGAYEVVRVRLPRFDMAKFAERSSA